MTAPPPPQISGRLTIRINLAGICLPPLPDAAPPPLNNYCKGGALPSRMHSTTSPPTILQGRSPCHPGCTATPPPSTISQGRSPCLPGCKAPPPLSTILQDGVLPTRMHSKLPPLNNIARAEPLPPMMHSNTSPSQQYARRRSLSFQDAQHHLPLSTILQGRSPCLPGCIALAPPSQQYCNGGALAS
ncbi:hypothetical protein LSTR_LSTR000641 [Laodelphax striatellus]|uniref:Uncharacterized protein n=1 Tax=Laodelphax striatellus TaxID=195883 RepID=A0A482XGR9_LAOST|nr:hypothetical protein LSTR_LSTR000641 [Laodelphax striatellus]